MNPLFLTPLFEIGKKLIDKVWPDPAQQAEAQAKLLQLQQTGELAALDAEVRLSLAQIEVNKLDAVGNFMQRSWRPFIGWVGGLGLAYQFLGYPMLVWLSRTQGWPEPPMLATEMLFNLVTSLLGLGAMRTFEKVKGAA